VSGLGVPDAVARTVKQRCRACGAQRCLELEQLEVGVLSGDSPASHCVVAPACRRCGYVEMLVGMAESQAHGERALFANAANSVTEAVGAFIDNTDYDEVEESASSKTADEISLWFQRQLAER
jgi:hypothetical protein